MLQKKNGECIVTVSVKIYSVELLYDFSTNQHLSFYACQKEQILVIVS